MLHARLQDTGQPLDISAGLPVLQADAGDRLVIVDFYAQWCHACRSLFPKVCTSATTCWRGQEVCPGPLQNLSDLGMRGTCCFRQLPKGRCLSGVMV